MSYAINIQSLTVQYQQTLALQDINLQIPNGVRAAIIGPNGAGKSTLMKAMLHLIPIQSGSIHLFNQPLNAVRHEIAYVPQTANVNWQFPATVLDVVLMGISSQRLGFKSIPNDTKKRALLALEQMQLIDLKNRPINQLSGGQKQRVFIARAIAQKANLYLLDEPLAAVDSTTEQLIMEQLQIFQTQNKTTLTVHHDLSTVTHYFDYVIMLNKHLITHGKVTDVFTDEWIARTYAYDKGGNNDG